MRAFLLISCIALLTGCTTGSTLRTARVLQQGEVEVSGGVAQTHFGHTAAVVIAAYGATDDVDIEARFEDSYFAFTPRYQLLRSEESEIDCLAFLELGGGDGGFHFGPGIMVGRRWEYIEPYASYRFRHYTSLPHNPYGTRFLGTRNIHFFKLGSRFHIPCFWGDPEQRQTQWFIGVEAGPTVFRKDVAFEWAANIGFDY